MGKHVALESALVLCRARPGLGCPVTLGSGKRLPVAIQRFLSAAPVQEGAAAPRAHEVPWLRAELERGIRSDFESVSSSCQLWEGASVSPSISGNKDSLPATMG